MAIKTYRFHFLESRGVVVTTLLVFRFSIRQLAKRLKQPNDQLGISQLKILPQPLFPCVSSPLDRSPRDKSCTLGLDPRYENTGLQLENYHLKYKIVISDNEVISALLPSSLSLSWSSLAVVVTPFMVVVGIVRSGIFTGKTLFLTD